MAAFVEEPGAGDAGGDGFGDVEDCRLCPGCYRPVYESSSSHTLIGAGPLPLMGLCRLCAEGSTLRSLRQADVPIDTRQRAVLETVAAALA
ncbi:hypothetical protein ACGF5T_30550 [Streptomyces sp. NPDC047853]|uniref:hypothetical protein n=1 Tax=unclassified Streptomyces TaxID=2593676 RepID=UPI0034544C6E